MGNNILILGTGAWATAIAKSISQNVNKISMYGIDRKEIEDINYSRKNDKYFSKIIKTRYLPENISAFFNMQAAVNNLDGKIDVVIIAVPTNAVESVIELLSLTIDIEKDKILFVNLAKGFCEDKTMSEIFFRSYKKVDLNGNAAYSVLLGPSHAEEVIVDKLTCVNLLYSDISYKYLIQEVFDSTYLKVIPKFVDYESIKCAEICSGLKNVYAILSGILDGLGYGKNARAALATYALKECKTILRNYDIPESYLSGVEELYGIGDLIVTCYSLDSRNFTAGHLIGELNSYEEFTKINDKTVEGLKACENIQNHLVNTKKLTLPLIGCVYNIMHNGMVPQGEVLRLFDNLE